MRAALVALAVCLVPYAAFLAMIPATGDQDSALHGIGAMHPKDPSYVLSVYSRPLFKLPYLLAGRFGWFAMRVLTVAICALAAWLTYLAAARLALPRPWLAIPFTLLQPMLVMVGTDPLTEPMFALVLAAGFLLRAQGRDLASAAVWSFLPLARPEGPVVLAVIAAMRLPTAWREQRVRAELLLLGLGMAVWELACIVVTGDPLYLFTTFPWRLSEPAYPGGSPLRYVLLWPVIIGAGLLPFWLAGLRPSWSRRTLREAIVMTAAVLLVHSVLFWTKGLMSPGFLRYFACLAPLAALIGLAGAQAWPRLIPACLALMGLQSFVTLDAQPATHYATATFEAVRVARERVGLDERKFLSANLHGYAVLGLDLGPDALPIGQPAEAALAIARRPSGTVAIWDDFVGRYWYHLSIEDFTSRGWRVVWERRDVLRSPRAGVYRPFTSHAEQPFRQAVLVKN